MDCRTCDHRKYHPDVLGWHTCEFSGCQVCPEDMRENLRCPLNLPAKAGCKLSMKSAQFCCSVLRQVRAHEKLEELLAHYTVEERAILMAALVTAEVDVVIQAAG